ncbi:MAG: gamma-glutamyltransferase [Planctomycetaceae bacterium]|nr:gamma-glutamyltransferase [Planctomycetaceae bacterium]
MHILRLVILTVVCGLVAPAFSRTEDTAESPEVRFANGCVAADHPLASEAGAEMLRQGGNVVDAAVATAFALSVVRPESCGLGGGGFMVIWNAGKQQAIAVDYRERAPARASRDMYLDLKGRATNGLASRHGGLAVAVPGEVAGLCFVLEEYGTLDRATVLAPAIRLAREGFAIDATFRAAQQEVLAELAEIPEADDRFSTLRNLYLNGGTPCQVGDRFHSPLVAVLERIASHGATGFHEGPVAAAIVAEVQRQQGILTTEDLSSMRPTGREPLRGRFQDDEIITMPPPSSGGVALIETLNILGAYEQIHPDQALAKLGHNTPRTVHLVAEALKHAFADRAEFLGDADFAKVPIERLLSREHATLIAAKIDPQHIQPHDMYGRFMPIDDSGTSHICVIDNEGNAVACTETINTHFGSFVVEPTYGIVLNNEMDDFAAVPGQPNVFGLLQSEANAIAPHKKPLSSMSPTILVRDGKAAVVVGGSGGPRIISATLQVLLNIVVHHQSVGDAVRSPRFHHQWLPETLYLESELTGPLTIPLEAAGHQITVREPLGVTQAAVRTEIGLSAACDPRKGGRPAGH